MLTPHEKAGLISLLEKVVEWVRDEAATTTPCTACVNYDCGNCQVVGEKIPDDVRQVGCELWRFDPNSPPI